MAHYARVVDNIVVDVIVADQDYIDELDGEWIKTSYNTHGGIHYDAETGQQDSKEPLRANYAVIGGSYDRTRDVFIPPKPFESWSLNEETFLWEPPVPEPNDLNATFGWDEEEQAWYKL